MLFENQIKSDRSQEAPIQLLIGSQPPEELIKISRLCIQAWKNYNQALSDYYHGKISAEERDRFFRVAMRIEFLCNKIAADYRSQFSLLIIPRNDFV